MPLFEYCPPFEVYLGGSKGVRPLFETHSFTSALENLRTRPDSRLTVDVLVTEGDVSTLIPISVPASEVKGKAIDDVRAMIEAQAELRFKPLTRYAPARAGASS